MAEMNEETGITRESAGMVQIREALGAVAVASPAVFWVYRDYDGAWCVRREGDGEDHQFPDRAAACDFVHVVAARHSAYRLFIARSDGRFSEELLHWPAPRWYRHDSSGDSWLRR
jgi:hypothetical protein